MLRRLIPYIAVLLIGALIVAGVIIFAGKSKPAEGKRQYPRDSRSYKK